ncbi:Tctex1 domain-containing protein 1-like [Elysia marginata]|uniref:Tctex1 domain-containing protein 1-like n=1 Tax=Elysia marginata TaxID=1093978 RepID=A0AAV4GYS4_9GAST|nr:Tctex1 domain-containing protein 1-like [Elysia marginata]
MTTIRKSSVMLPGRADGATNGPKLSLATVAPKTPLPKTPGTPKRSTAGIDRQMSSFLSRRLAAAKDNASSAGDPAGSEDARSSVGDGAKKNSVVSGMFSRPSMSSGSNQRLSLVGLMASRRFAKKLMGRALEKRESTLGDGPPPVNYEPTYRMEPKSKFNTASVLEAVKDVIDNRLKDMK